MSDKGVDILEDCSVTAAGIYTHLIVGAAVILLAVFLERTVYIQYDRLKEAPVILNEYMAIAPGYNMDGSWLHGRLGIGYNGPLLCLEYILTFLVSVYLFRFMEGVHFFFQIKGGKWWLYAVDLEAAVMLYRLISKIYSPYTLDYLYIRGQGTFDFPDLCIGAGIIAILLWTVLFMCRYYPFRKKQTAGMSFWEKCRWEMGISWACIKAGVIPKDRWPDLFAGWNRS